MERKEDTFKTETNNILAKVAGVLTFALLFIFPLYVEDRYANILRAKYRFYFTSVLAAFGVVVVLSLVFLFIDRMENGGARTKAWFARLSPKNWKEYFAPFEGALICFMAAAVISALQSEYFYESVWGNEGRYSGAFLLLVYGVSVFLIGRLFRFKQWYLEAFLISSLLVCFFGITDYFHLNVLGFKTGLSMESMNIFTSTFGNINTYTAFVVMAMGLAAVLYAAADTRKKMIWYYVCVVIIFTAAITGQSDNVYLALAVLFGFLPFYCFGTWKGIRRYVIMAASLLTIIWILGLMDASIKGNEAWQVIGLDGLARFAGGFSGTPVIAAILWALAAGLFALEKKRGVTGRTSSAGKTGDLAGKWPRRIWAAVVILTVVVILAVLYDANVAGHGERYGAAANYLIFNDSWGTDRGFAWRFAMELYDQFPFIHKLFGYGPDTFGILTTSYTGSTATKMYEDLGVIYDSVHNAYLQYLVTIGLAGLVSYLAFLILAIVWIVRRGRKSPAVMACAFAVCCYCGQAVVNIDLPAVTPVFWTLLAVGVAAVRTEKK